MDSAATYFRHIKDAVVSIFDGMAVTASHLIRKPFTIQYPDRVPIRVQDTLPFRYRGILDVDMEICTGCLACDRACPIDCIAMAIQKNAQTREITISQFDIDIAKCMFCGLCSEPCPTGAIHHTTEFEGADFSLESLIRRFITEPTIAYKPKKGPEPDPDTAQLLDRGMKYVDEWAQPGSDKPPATAAKPAPVPVKAAPKPATPSATVTPSSPAAAAPSAPPEPAAPPSEGPPPPTAAAVAPTTPNAPGAPPSETAPPSKVAAAAPDAAATPAPPSDASSAPATASAPAPAKPPTEDSE